MCNNLFDYHSLKSKIFDESDKLLFDEIVKCIEVDALRSAAVMICVSFTESLYKKLEILSESNKKIVKDLENYRNENKDFLLLNYAKKYELISEIEYKQLDTIMNARNNYAHPNFESPTENQVISYLYFSVEYILSKPPYYSFLYAKSLIENHLSKDPFYLEGKNNIQIQLYARTFFKRLDKNSLINVLKLLFKYLEDLYISHDENKDRCIDNCLIYLNELLNMEEISLSEEEVNDYLDKYRYTSCHIFTFSNNWIDLDFRSKSRIFNYSSDFENGILSEREFINIFYPLYEYDLLDMNFESKFEYILTKMPPSSLINYNLNPKIYYDKIINYFKMYSWSYQNEAMRSLYKIDLTKFSDFELEEIGRNILQSAEGNAWDCIDLLDCFYNQKNTKFHNINILRGLVNEVFVNEENYFRFKSKSAEKALCILYQYPNKKYILNTLLNNIKSSKPKNSDFNRFIRAKNFLFKLKTKNDLLSEDIDLIISSINHAICNSINILFNEDYRQILTYNNYKILTPYVYCCLNESKREIFSDLANEDTLNFIRFFSKTHRFVENGSNKIEVEIRWDLLEKFINPRDLLKSIEEIDLNDLAKADRAILEEFLKNYK